MWDGKIESFRLRWPKRTQSSFQLHALSLPGCQIVARTGQQLRRSNVAEAQWQKDLQAKLFHPMKKTLLAFEATTHK